MFTMRATLLSAIAMAANGAYAQVVGTAPGFATGTTGGGSATPQTPSSLDE